jgi:hypothetical protein
MGKGDSKQPEDELKSSIGHHSTYIWETKRVLQEYTDVESYEELKERVVVDNILNKGSEEYRRRMLSEIAMRCDLDRDEYEETALIKAINSSIPDSLKDWILYYQYSKDNTVRLVTQDFLYRKYKQGILSVSKKDVIDFLDSIEEDHPEVGEWTEHTKDEVAKHYLTALKNFGVLEGSKKKEFQYIHPPDRLIAYILYSLFERGLTTADGVIKDDDWKILLLGEDEVRNRINDITPEYVGYEKRGSVERLEPKYDSIKECVDDF